MSILGFLYFRWSLFLVESLLATLPLFFVKLEKKTHFGWRLLFFACLFLGSLFGIVTFQNETMTANGSNDVLMTFFSCVVYIYFLALIAGMILFVFKGNIYTLFSSFVKSYTLRQTSFCLYILIVTLADPELNFLDIRYIDWASGILYASVFLLCYGTAFFLVFKRKIPIYETPVDKPILAFYIIVLLANIIINAVCEYYSRDYRLMYSLVMFSQLLSIVLIVAFDWLVKRSRDLKVQNYITNQMLRQQEWQYRFAKTNMEQLRIRAHDLKHQVRILRQGGKEAEELLKSLEDEIGGYDAILYTDNQVLNIILQEKWYYCKKHDIKLTTIVNPKAFGKVTNTDLYTLIGNILDNAIEAVMKIEDREKRIISVEIGYRNTLSTFRCDNYFQGELKKDDEGLVTNKKDKLQHGLGLKSIEIIAKKYGGNTEIMTDGDIFTLLVTIPDNV